MRNKLNIQPVRVSGGGASTVINVLNGAFASLSGPIGFTPTQPRIRVTGIQIGSIPPGGNSGFTLYKGNALGNAPGTEVFEYTPGGVVSAGPGTTYASPIVGELFPLDIVLDASDFLTAASPGSPTAAYTINLSAEIEF